MSEMVDRAMTRADLDRLSAEADRAMARLNRKWRWYEVRQSIRSYFAAMWEALK